MLWIVWYGWKREDPGVEKTESQILEGIHIKLTCKWAAGTAQAE